MFMVVALFCFSSALAQDETVTNDETQTRLRVNHCVFDGPNVDIFVNGEVAVNAGVPQTNVPAGQTWGYLYLDPNTYSLAVVPTGKELSQALMGPVDVTVEAGHRYTVVVMGQADEAPNQPLVIDETAAYQDIGAKPTDAGHITVNNVKGSEGVTFTQGGVVREENVPYGEFQAALWSTETYTSFELAILDTTGEVVAVAGESLGGSLAGQDSIDCVGGTPGTVLQDWYNRSSPTTSTLSTPVFLKAFSSTEGSSDSFDTFLTAVETAGLTNLLTNGGPHFVLAPTDEAFAALPKDQFDALMADPEALAELLRYHIVEGYYPVGALGGEERRGKVLMNLLGMELELKAGGGWINGTPVGDIESVVVANGTRVGPITAVLLPPEQ